MLPSNVRSTHSQSHRTSVQPQYSEQGHGDVAWNEDRSSKTARHIRGKELTKCTSTMRALYPEGPFWGDQEGVTRADVYKFDTISRSFG